MTTQTLTEICALKEINYYGERCNHCQGNESKMCYTTEQELRKHIEDYRGYSLLHPQVQGFYIRYGNKWREQARSLR